MELPKIPLGEWIEFVVKLMQDTLEPLFEIVTNTIGGFVDFIVLLLTSIPPFLLILIIAFIAFWVSRWTIGLFSFIGLFLIYNLGYWEPMIDTLALVLTSVFISIIIGIPIGIWMSQSNRVQGGPDTYP